MARISELEMWRSGLPRFYGAAWRDPSCRVLVCYLIPFNWVFGWLRGFYYFVCRGPRSGLEEKVREEERNERERLAEQWGQRCEAIRNESYIRGVNEGRYVTLKRLEWDVTQTTRR